MRFVVVKAKKLRYAIVETRVDLAVALEPEPGPWSLSDFLEFAERDCVVGSSLVAEPRSRWTVNGGTIGS
jgi:hypothetical protein